MTPSRPQPGVSTGVSRVSEPRGGGIVGINERSTERGVGTALPDPDVGAPAAPGGERGGAAAETMQQWLPAHILTISAVTWNSASALGGFGSDPRRHRLKHLAIERMCNRNDVVTLQESRGQAADLDYLPSSHVWRGTFFRTDDFASSSRAGGVVIGVSRQMLRDGVLTSVEVDRGRCLAVHLAFARGAVEVVSVHLDPALGRRAKEQFLGKIRAHVDYLSPHAVLLGGDWNFLASGDVRLDTMRGESREATNIASFFGEKISDFVELSQAQFTFGRLYGDGQRSSFSRIDRWYANFDPDRMGKVLASVAVEGSLTDRQRPSDHLPLRLVLSHRRGRRARRLAVPDEVARSPVFQAAYLRTIAGWSAEQIVRDGFRRVLEAARDVARTTARQLLRDDMAGPRVLAEAALRVYVAVRDGDVEEAERMTLVKPRLRRLRGRGGWDPQLILEFYRAQMEGLQGHRGAGQELRARHVQGTAPIAAPETTRGGSQAAAPGAPRRFVRRARRPDRRHGRDRHGVGRLLVSHLQRQLRRR